VENSSEVQWFSGSVVVQRFRALCENSSEVHWFRGSGHLVKIVQRFSGSVVQRIVVVVVRWKA
jgi:hypothetical protein